MAFRFTVLRCLTPLRAISMPMRSSAVSALRVIRVPCARGGFALLVACVSCGVGAFRAVARRCGRLVAFCLISLFGDECSALGLVELDVTANFARFAVAQDFADRVKCER
eukprot:5329219-Pleurochrysis_carterae.AAC.2